MANADVFNRMRGASRLPTYAEGKPEAVVGDLEARSSGAPYQQMAESSAPMASRETPKAPDLISERGYELGQMLGSGGYIYEKLPTGFKIIKGKGGEGTVVTPDSPFYDLIRKDVELVAQKPELHKMDLLAKPAKPAAPKATVTPGGVEGMEIETPAPPAAPAPAMTQAEYEDTLIAAPQGSKVPPPPTRAGPESEFGTRAYMREKVGGAMEKLGEMASKIPTTRKEIYGARESMSMAGPEEMFKNYIASEQLRSSGHDAVQALMKNGMDFVAARRFVTNAIETDGEKALPMFRALAYGSRPAPAPSQSKSPASAKK